MSGGRRVLVRVPLLLVLGWDGDGGGSAAPCRGREKLGGGPEGRLFSVSRPAPQYERGCLRGGGRGA